MRALTLARRTVLPGALALAGVAPAQAAEVVIERGPPVSLGASPAAQQTVRDFSRAYAQAGRPRIALWWNRQLSDRHSEHSREVARVQAELSADGRRASLSSSRGPEGQGDALRPRLLSERDLFQVETEFTRRLLDAGVRLIDRATILRLTAGQAGSAQAGALDAQRLEMQALRGHADHFLEVLLSADSTAPLGVGFRIDLKAVADGQVLGTAYLSGLPELPATGPGRYEAQPGGYVLVPAPPPAVSVQAVGDALALQTLQELGGRLQPRTGR